MLNKRDVSNPAKKNQETGNPKKPPGLSPFIFFVFFPQPDVLYFLSLANEYPTPLQDLKGSREPPMYSRTSY